MRKFFVCVLAMLCALAPCSLAARGRDVCFAQDEQKEQVLDALDLAIAGFVDASNPESDRHDRLAGTLEERKAAFYVKQQLMGLENFKPAEGASIVEGVQSFQYVSSDGKTYASQNIIFRKASAAVGAKKVVLCTHIDMDIRSTTLDTGERINVEGVADNGASVGLLLSLAKALDGADDLGFDIELVFFGASMDGHNGSLFYSRGMTKQEADNILLAINFERVGVGAYNYMYVDEFATPQEDFFRSTAQDFKKLRPELTAYTGESLNGLEYTHIGLESDNAVFMSRGINSLSFLSGDYENSLSIGHREFENKENVAGTSGDNYAQILEGHPELMNNLYMVYTGVLDILSEDGFIAEMEKSNNVAASYSFWTNEMLAAIVTAVVLCLMILTYYLLYRRLKKRSAALVGKDIDQLVVRINENLGGVDEQVNNIIEQKVRHDTQKSKEEEDDKEGK